MNIQYLMRVLIIGCFFAAQFLPPANAVEPLVAGTVIYVQGNAVSRHRESSFNLSPGALIRVGDHIVTGNPARIGLRMIDGAVISLGADTEFAVNDYSYHERAEQGIARLELIKGVFRAVTGEIGKLKGHDFKVKTAVGTIGTRGTDFWGGFYFSQALDVALLGGKGIFIENAAGTTEISQPGDGITVPSIDKLPLQPSHWNEQKLNSAKQSISLENIE